MNIFDQECTYDDAKVVYIPVPWDATTSYGKGTSKGPEAILFASAQLDLFDAELGRIDHAGLHYFEKNNPVLQWNQKALWESQAKNANHLKIINNLSDQLNQWVHQQTLKLYRDQKIPGIIGGEHSISYGAIQAASEKFSKISILHFDAHLDLRKAYQGYTHSHASIMNNVMTSLPGVEKLISVGIRDFCEEEKKFVTENKNRIHVFWDSVLWDHKLNHRPWAEISDKIVNSLGDNVWISFDIDGLDPQFCPHTGTPVPGGLHFKEAVFILKKLAQSGRKIIGFDLNEVAPAPAWNAEKSQASEEWDANVGMRLLYQMTGWTLYSQGLLKK